MCHSDPGSHEVWSHVRGFKGPAKSDVAVETRQKMNKIANADADLAEVFDCRRRGGAGTVTTGMNATARILSKKKK